MRYFMFLLVAACAHPVPREWWPADHKDMMSECSAMCRGKVKSYRPHDGECTCATPGGKR